MDPFDRYLRRTLDEVLVAQGIATRERMDELLASARETNELLGVVVLEAGALSPWDFAKLIATQYQLPVQQLSQADYRFRRNHFGLSNSNRVKCINAIAFQQSSRARC